MNKKLVLEEEELRDNIKQVLEEVGKEVERSKKLFPEMQTNHDGYGVIREEFDEFWDEIKKLKPRQFSDELRAETVQLAAMAVRFLLDRCAPCNERVVRYRKDE